MSKSMTDGSVVNKRPEDEWPLNQYLGNCTDGVFMDGK